MQDDHVYRKTDLVGSSKESVTKAIETAIARAAKTLRHIEWFEVGEIRGRVQDDKQGTTLASLSCRTVDYDPPLDTMAYHRKLFASVAAKYQ